MISKESVDVSDRRILHVDFDYFFAQCEEIRNPSLKAKPVVVCVFSGRTEESGVVSTSNYYARKYGVYSGMPIKSAKSKLRDVPDAVFLPVDSRYYSQVSAEAMFVVESYADRFQQVGIDECYLDVSQRTASLKKAKDLAMKIKKDLKEQTRLTCSIGVASNKLVAKILSDMNKPDGLTTIDSERAASFIADLDVSKIPGIGSKTSSRLKELKIRTIGDLAQSDTFRLIEEFGRNTATYMHNASHGIDPSPVIESAARKQIGRIITLRTDASKSEELYPELRDVCDSVFRTAMSRKLSFKVVGIVLILDNLDQVSKTKTLKTHSISYDLLHSSAESMIDDAMQSGDMKVRRLGVRLSDLRSSEGQNTLSGFMGD